MERLVGAVCLLLAGVASAQPAFEADLGAGVDHIAGHTCVDSYGAPYECGDRLGPAGQLGATELWDRTWPVTPLVRATAAVGQSLTAGASFVRGYVGIGARYQPLVWADIEATVGRDLQLGNKADASDNPQSSASDTCFTARLGAHTTQWGLAVEGVLAPGALHRAGLAGYGFFIAGSWRLGN